MTSKKIFYMSNSACRWFIVGNPKIFRNYVKYYWIFLRERYCRILIALCKKVSMNHPIMLLDQDKTSNMKTPTQKISTQMRILSWKTPTKETSHPGKLPPRQFLPRKFPPRIIVTPNNCNPPNLRKFNNT